MNFHIFQEKKWIQSGSTFMFFLVNVLEVKAFSVYLFFFSLYVSENASKIFCTKKKKNLCIFKVLKLLGKPK